MNEIIMYTVDYCPYCKKAEMFFKERNIPFKNIDTTKQDPIILGIETSCDETAAAVVRGREILSDEIASSASIQALYGGVVPEIASRKHIEAIYGLAEQALFADDIDINLKILDRGDALGKV